MYEMEKDAKEKSENKNKQQIIYLMTVIIMAS